jgi:tetratricopeptide (TPR) repeat protein
MEQLAMPGSTLLAAPTLRLAEGYVEVKPLGPLTIKGLGDAVEAFELAGASAARTRIQARAGRGLSRFVGRDAEIELLESALREAGEERGQVVAAVGEAGVGKSRLLYEFVHSHRTQGWLTLESGSVSYGKASSYLPVTDLLRTYFGIGDRDDRRAIREKVTGKLLALDRGLEPFLPPVRALLEVEAPDSEWQALDPGRRRQRTLDAVKRLLLRESQEQPLVLVFEDLHWVDSETQALLDGVVESLPAARILLLVNYRPEYQHGWGSKTYYRQLRLDPLPPESAGELLDALVGAGSELATLKRLLMDRTQGNPFFLEESVRALVENGALTGRPGAYRLAMPVSTIQAPATVQAVLSARIDRLPPDEKRLLETAAVIGKDLPFALLQAVVDLPESGLTQALSHLQAGEFLYETSLFPDLEYTFKHALTHEVAYGALLHERRRALHARIVGAIETLYPGRLAEHVERLGHHALRGEVWDKATAYLRQAGAKALARYAVRDASELFQQALGGLEHLPASRERAELAIDLRFDLRHCLVLLGRLDEMGQRLQEAEALAATIGDQRRLGWTYAYETWWLAMAPDHGDPRDAIKIGDRALSIAAELDNLELLLSARYFQSLAQHHRGNYRRAIELVLENVHLRSGEQARHRSNLAAGTLPSVVSRLQLAYSLSQVGEFGKGIVVIREGLTILDADEYINLLLLYVGLGVLLQAKGDADDAIVALERALHLAELSGFQSAVSQTASRLGLAYVLAGRTAEALPILERAADARVPRGRSESWAALGEGYLAAGRVREAREQAWSALRVARTYGERGSEAWALWLLGEIASVGDENWPEEAESQYRHAIGIAHELGMRPLIAHCHLGLGRLYARTDDGGRSREHLDAAAGMYREMDMTFWLARTEALARR